MRHSWAFALLGILSLGVADQLSAAVITFGGLQNGLEIQNGTNTFGLATITSNKPLAVFNTDDPGPNTAGSDPDLVVNDPSIGNVLIIQKTNGSFGDQTVNGIFDTPNDDASGGTISFNFLIGVELLSIDLIDIDRGAQTKVTLTDSDGDQRVYNVPQNWTFDVSQNGLPSGAKGFGKLDLTTLLNQPGENSGTATASEIGLFSSKDVVRLDVRFSGSAALDNVSFLGPGEISEIPEPSSLFAFAGLAGLASIAFLRRRRNR